MRVGPPACRVSQAVGFYGKLPSRGDFVRVGLPRSFTDPWDAWWQQGIAVTRAATADWTEAWLEAPVWRFHLPAGLCGPGPVLGLWMPSVDRANRYFPLTLATVGHGGAPAGFLDEAEQAGLDALAHDMEPDALAERLRAAFAAGMGETLPAPGWWTAGGPRVAARTLSTGELPHRAAFATMIADAWASLETCA